MPNNPTDNRAENIDNTPKRFESLEDLKALEEFPDTKAMIIADYQGDIVYANRSFESLFKLKEGSNFRDFESEPGLSTLLESLAESMYSSFHFELLYTGQNASSYSQYLVEIERIFIGESEYFVFILTSLEDRLKIENRINSLHHALEFGNVPVIITDTQGRITYSTKSFEDILKSNIELIYNKPLPEVFQNLLDHHDMQEVTEKLKNFESCMKIISDINEEGSLWYKELMITPVKRDDQDPANFIITANDITSYVLNTRLIKRSEERLKSIINNISDLLLIVRSERGCLHYENANDNFNQTFELKREKVLGKNIEDIFDRHFLLILTEAINSLVRNKNFAQEFRYKNYIMEKEYLGSITYTDDHYEEHRIFIISLKDITLQLINEEKLRKAYQKETHVNKLKSSFLANMSHEIRTPLNAIVGYSELIEDDVKSGSTESALELFTYLKEGFNRLLNLVDNILEVSLIQSGETELDIVSTNVFSVLKKVFNVMMNFAVEKTMSFDMNIEDEELSINADPQKLEKVIKVLVDNAIKYTEESGRVVISSKFENNLAIIKVSDTGKGIHQENLDRMFEPFTQEDEGHKRQYEGAGLGLTIAYNLTKMMGGKLEVDSVLNQGTTITLSFPGKIV